MQTEVTIEALETQLLSAKEAKEKLERLQRLCANRDFKDLILEDYGIRECARLTHMSIHPSQDKDEAAKFLKMAQACGGVAMYIYAQERMLKQTINDIPRLEEELESMRAEPEGEE